MTTRNLRASKRWMVAAAAVAVGASTVAASGGASATTTVTGDRIGGDNRFETAAFVNSDEDWGLDDCDVFVANGLNFPDGLAASTYGDAVLLTEADSIPADTLVELNRLAGPTAPGQPDITECDSGDLDIAVVGGTAAVSSAVFDQLATFANDGGSIVRLAGANRYETALKVAAFYGNSSTVIMATGLNFPDALAAGPLGYEEGPLLLNDGETVRPDVGAYIKATGVTKVYIVGGTSVVPQSVEDDLKFEYGVTVERLAGANRAETAVKVAEELISIDADYEDGVLLVNQTTFADALPAGPLGADWEFPLLMVDSDSIPAATAAYHVKHSVSIDDVIAIGGTSVISKAVLDGAVAAAKPVAAKITTATLAVSDVKQGVFAVSGTLNVTADAVVPGPAVNVWAIEFVQNATPGTETVKVLTDPGQCTPACTNLPKFEVTANFNGLPESAFVTLWNGSPAGDLTTAVSSNGVATFGGAPAPINAPTTPGTQDTTVVVTFDQKINNPIPLLGATGIYDSSNVAATQLLSAAPAAGLTTTFDAVAANKLTLAYDNSPVPVSVGNDEVRMATNEITTVTNITNTTAPIVKRLIAAS